MKSLMGDLSAVRAGADNKNVPDLMMATAGVESPNDDLLQRARQFAVPFLTGQKQNSGQDMLAHADDVTAILKNVGGSVTMQAASYLVYACAHLHRPHEVITNAFDENLADLAVEANKLMQVERQARSASRAEQPDGSTALQTEKLRKMLLAFSRDLRVVMLRLASRLQYMRYCAEHKKAVSRLIAEETLHVYAPLANRLGIWQMKWELEDLAFRSLEPQTYREIAHALDETRIQREMYMEQLRMHIERSLHDEVGIGAAVQGRPKHIYSIVKKMRGKSLHFDQMFDIRALRVIVSTVDDCYKALSWIHSHFTPLTEEFDDYIAKPKPNGYRSLHTVVRDDAGKAIEIQIRTQEMHEYAEHGTAAHWAYKEAGSKGYGGAVSASSSYDAKIAVLRQLLAWGQDLSDGTRDKASLFDDRIYVLTPDAAIVELTQGATPVDFAYAVHTSVGHRCRGARVDGAMLPLNTPLKNGQTVEIVTTKEGGPSRDWLNSELGYLNSPRAKAKVRAWFNAQITNETIARGRETVEKLLQREGKTAIKLEDIAVQLNFRSADDLFEQVGKEEYSLRHIEALLRQSNAPPPMEDEQSIVKKARSSQRPPKGGVSVLGIDSLLTQLARCCKPAPPDPIGGFVTKGKGVSIHRSSCSNYIQMAERNPDRVIAVRWNSDKPAEGAVYPVDVSVTAADRQGLLRDISEVFTREKINVIGVNTQSARSLARMVFTVEVTEIGKLQYALKEVSAIKGVRSARRV